MLKPDFYESSFIVTDNKNSLPISNVGEIEFTENEIRILVLGNTIIIIIISSVFNIFLKKEIRLNHNLLKLNLFGIHFQD